MQVGSAIVARPLGFRPTLLVAEGRDVVYVARQLGHADPNVTLRTYAKLFDRQRHEDETRAGLEARYGSALEALAQSDEVPAVPAHRRKVVGMRVRD